ncbi:hypothetical protein BaRGS_00002148 [Batillaria attramentaria]|uniref:DNA primase large subunit C-terminal domain-containing protein n=1 Tax=Batillaria attramentaria TaxID=370345 RepID=A0ABD0M669_9CAEN
MTLYFEPPTGNISLQKLETFAVKRLELLLKVHAARGDVCRLQQVLCDEAVVAGSDCLIAGSTKDKVSHFILRLLIGGDPQMHTFFSQAEATLFDFHFSCMSEEEMNKFFHKVDRLLLKENIRISTPVLPKDFNVKDHLYRSRAPGGNSGYSMHHLSLEEVDTMVTSYPLCMASLLRTLRQKHRLGHHARIQLTLFLKEMGLPVHHALALWQGEYSQPPGSGSRCSHSWQKDGRRYTYSIRHLYGLEGARRNYRAHCCQSLQQTVLGCSEEGGCPYAHWDDTTLTAELSDTLRLQAAHLTEVLKLRGSGHYSAACQSTLGSSSLMETQRFMQLDTETLVKDSCVKGNADLQDMSCANGSNKTLGNTATGMPKSGFLVKTEHSVCWEPSPSLKGHGVVGIQREVEVKQCSGLQQPCSTAFMAKTETKLLPELAGFQSWGGSGTTACVPNKVENMGSSVLGHFFSSRMNLGSEVIADLEVRGDSKDKIVDMILLGTSSDKNDGLTTHVAAENVRAAALFRTEPTHRTTANDRSSTDTGISVRNSSLEVKLKFDDTTTNKQTQMVNAVTSTARVTASAATPLCLESDTAVTVQRCSRESDPKRRKLSQSSDSTVPGQLKRDVRDMCYQGQDVSSLLEAACASESRFEHEVCPSQVCDRHERHFVQSRTPTEVEIVKPVDYFYLSYRQLLNGLQSDVSIGAEIKI